MAMCDLGWLTPQIFRENRARILPGKSGLLGADWSLLRGPFGADEDQFLRTVTSQPHGRVEIAPTGVFLA